MRTSISGIVAARQAFARIPEAHREMINEVNAESAGAIVYGARSRVRKRTGALMLSIASTVDKRRGTAKVGVEAKGAVYYGHFVEFGTVTQPARPFMIPAGEAERGQREARFKAAGRRLETDVASVGGRTL